jgi:hypothetical protein
MRKLPALPAAVLAIAFLLSYFSTPATAIIMRDDRDEQRVVFLSFRHLSPFNMALLLSVCRMPGRQPNDRDSKSNRGRSIVCLCICGAMRSFVGGASTSRSAVYV